MLHDLISHPAPELLGAELRANIRQTNKIILPGVLWPDQTFKL